MSIAACSADQKAASLPFSSLIPTYSAPQSPCRGKRWGQYPKSSHRFLRTLLGGSRTETEQGDASLAMMARTRYSGSDNRFHQFWWSFVRLSVKTDGSSRGRQDLPNHLLFSACRTRFATTFSKLPQMSIRFRAESLQTNKRHGKPPLGRMRNQSAH